MRSIARRFLSLPIVLSLCACTATTDSDTEGDEDVATESSADAVSVTSTPGKAVWTKVWRWQTEDAPTRATDVASDETGAAFVTRAKSTINDINMEASSVDVARYTPTGSLSYRVDLGAHTQVTSGTVRVAARAAV